MLRLSPTGPNGKRLRMSEAIWDMEIYSRINDSVFERILWSTEPELKEARDKATQIQRRQLYRCIGKHKVILTRFYFRSKN